MQICKLLQQDPSGALVCPEDRAKLAAPRASTPVCFTHSAFWAFKLKEQLLSLKKASKTKILKPVVYFLISYRLLSDCLSLGSPQVSRGKSI